MKAIGLGRTTKLPEAGLEHRKILPLSSCCDWDQGWVVGSQQYPLPNRNSKRGVYNTLTKAKEKNLYMYML